MAMGSISNAMSTVATTTGLVIGIKGAQISMGALKDLSRSHRYKPMKAYKAKKLKKVI